MGRRAKDEIRDIIVGTYLKDFRKIHGREPSKGLEKTQWGAAKYQDVVKKITDVFERTNGPVSVAMEKAAPELLIKTVAANAEFNNYSGNLNHAYYAQIGNGSGRTKLIQVDDKIAPWGRITKGVGYAAGHGYLKRYKNGKAVYKISKSRRRHHHGRVIKLSYGRHGLWRVVKFSVGTKDKRYKGGVRRRYYESLYEKTDKELLQMQRYAKKDQKFDGYIAYARRMASKMSHSRVRGKRGFVKNYIRIFNSAPYAYNIGLYKSMPIYGKYFSTMRQVSMKYFAMEFNRHGLVLK